MLREHGLFRGSGVPPLLRPATLLAWTTCLSSFAHGQDDPAAPSQASPLGQVVTRLAEENGQKAPFDVVVAHLRRVPAKHPAIPHRLSRIVGLFQDPWSGQARAAELRDGLLAPFANPKAAEFSSIGPLVADWLDSREQGEDGEDDELDDDAKAKLATLDAAWDAVMDETAAGAELMTRLSAFCGAMNDTLTFALRELDDAGRSDLFAHAGGALEGWYRGHSPKPEVAPELNESFAKTFNALPKIDRRLLLAASRRAMRLADPPFRNGFAARLNKLKPTGKLPDGFKGDVLAIAGDSDANRVVLGGPQKTTYEGAAALILDLAGNDVYERAAVADGGSRLFSAVIDLRGDDVWRSGGIGPCASIAGCALLVDLGGKDSYTSKRLGQAASVGGFAFLFDADGNDTYVMEDYGQGCGVHGVGLLFDGAGNDERTAWAYAQGASLTAGFGACVDDKGDDRYLADLHWPDVYGDSGPNSFHGASQGYSTGIRSDGQGTPGSAGGIGVLVDRLGKDRYQSGNFSQGGAYYFSFGLMYDGGGDDENFGYRYSQGFGVHQAIGVRWDAGGNDVYHTRCAANLGSAWDEGIGFFLEDAGDDVYDEQGGLALGGAAQTAIALFVDSDGKDSYTGGGTDAQGGTGGFEYHNAPSIGTLLDLGGKKDTYSRAGRADGVLGSDDKVGLFLDTGKKSLGELLALPKLK